MALFYFASDSLNEDITHIELCPIQLFDNTYLCGLQLIDENNEIIWAHLKTYNENEIKKSLTMESALPNKDYYMDIDQLEEKNFISTFVNFKTNFFDLVLNSNSYTVANVTLPNNRKINAICESKKITCKFILNLRKTYGNTTKQKFKHYGYADTQQKKQHEIPTIEEMALELVTS